MATTPPLLLLPTWLGNDVTQYGIVCWFLSQIQNLRDNNRNLGLDVSTLAHTCDQLSDELQTSQEESTFWENQYATKNGEVGGTQDTLMSPHLPILLLPSLCPFSPPSFPLSPPSFISLSLSLSLAFLPRPRSYTPPFPSFSLLKIAWLSCIVPVYKKIVMVDGGR